MYKRIIGLVLIENGIVCRTRNFDTDYHYTNNFIDTTYFDEIAFIDVTKQRTSQSLEFFSLVVDELMTDSQLPVSMGGGIKSVQDIEYYRQVGADRFIINQSTTQSDQLVSEAIRIYGQSSVISSIDHWGKKVYAKGEVSTLSVGERIKQIAGNCGSEILINSVEMDGSLRGLDALALDTLSEFPELSFIVTGGVGKADHVEIALAIANVQGVCTSNIYHLTTNTISNWRQIMVNNSVEIRSI